MRTSLYRTRRDAVLAKEWERIQDILTRRARRRRAASAKRDMLRHRRDLYSSIRSTPAFIPSLEALIRSYTAPSEDDVRHQYDAVIGQMQDLIGKWQEFRTEMWFDSVVKNMLFDEYALGRRDDAGIRWNQRQPRYHEGFFFTEASRQESDRINTMTAYDI